MTNATLLHTAQSSTKASDASKAIYALYRSYVIQISEYKGQLGSEVWNEFCAFAEFLGGLLRDREKGLRLSALQILFSLLKHLSKPVNSNSQSKLNAKAQQQNGKRKRNDDNGQDIGGERQLPFHLVHFNRIVASLLLCPPCIRPRDGSAGGVGEREGGKLDLDVRDLFVEEWLSVYDDIRWFFLRESATLLNKTQLDAHPHLPANLLSILERLSTFPTEEGELNAWWVSELGERPFFARKKKEKENTKQSGVKGGGKESSSEEEDDEVEDNLEQDEGADDDDWRKFFDNPSLSKSKSKQAQKSGNKRLHTLTTHQSLHSLASHRAVFTRCWLALLPRLSWVDSLGKKDDRDREKVKALSIRALQVMHRGVMPHLTKAVLVMDWVGGCVDIGGAIGLLGLNALFVLMKEYNLDYPSFYTRLYAFLDRDVLHSKHRARFFRLTELFLSSTHLPATLLASFVKRLSRLSLHAPPAAIIMVIPFVYNVLKKHPSLMVMIHRVEFEPKQDPFDMNEPNPILTRALDSSLWELYSQKGHYHSAVSTLVKVLEEAFTKHGYSMEDFLDHTYGTLLETETKRKIRKEPAVAIELVRDLFPSTRNCGEEGTMNDVVAELWTFDS